MWWFILGMLLGLCCGIVLAKIVVSVCSRKFNEFIVALQARDDKLAYLRWQVEMLQGQKALAEDPDTALVEELKARRDVST